MQLRATFKALYTVIFHDHRKNVEQLLREYDSVMAPLYIIFSKTLLKMESREIGLWFDFLVARPFLNTGETLTILSLSGKISVSKDLLIKVDRLSEMRECKIYFIGILLGPQDLPFFRD